MGRSRVIAALVFWGFAWGLLAFQGSAPERRREVPSERQPDLPVVEREVQGPLPPTREQDDTKFRFTSTADDAVSWAAADASALNPEDAAYVRYLWIQDGSPVARKVTSLAVNFVSRASSIRLPAGIALGPPTRDAIDRKCYLLRIDLRQFAPLPGNRSAWTELWEELAFDPSFSKLVTRDNITLLTNEQRNALPRTVRQRVVKRMIPATPGRKEERVLRVDKVPFVAPDGRRYDSDRVVVGKQYTFELEWPGTPEREEVEAVNEEVAAFSGPDVDVVRFNRGDIDPTGFLALQAITRSAAPVVEYRYFIYRALSTIKETVPGSKLVYKKVYGGLYYDLEGGSRLAKDVQGKDTKATDLDQFFDDLGIGNIRGGLTSDQLFDRLRSDQRIALLRSLITGKPRDIDAFNVPAAKRWPWGAISGDINDDDIDIGDRGYANLLTPRRRAREALFPKANGLIRCSLFNGQGARQDRVPPQVAHDRTIPAPHTMELQAAISCIRCHAPHDMWQPAKNDAKTLIAATRADIFGDLKSRRGVVDDVDRLAGWFDGDFDGNLRDARDGYAAAVLKATGPWKEDPTGANVGKIGSARLADAYGQYWYDAVDAKSALADLGVIAPKEREVEVLTALCPPDLRLRVGGIFLTDPRELGPLSGLAVNRADWDLVKAYVAERAKPQIVALKRRANP